MLYSEMIASMMAFDLQILFWEHDEFQTLNKTSTSKPRHIFQLETYTSYQSVFFR